MRLRNETRKVKAGRVRKINKEKRKRGRKEKKKLEGEDIHGNGNEIDSRSIVNSSRCTSVPGERYAEKRRIIVGMKTTETLLSIEKNE